MIPKESRCVGIERFTLFKSAKWQLASIIGITTCIAGWGIGIESTQTYIKECITSLKDYPQLSLDLCTDKCFRAIYLDRKQEFSSVDEQLRRLRLAHQVPDLTARIVDTAYKEAMHVCDLSGKTK
jgi:hypothetical protein